VAEIILGVTGSIAAYKAADLCSKLGQANHAVSVVMTENATKLVGTSTFLNLSGRKVFSDLWTDAQGQIEHISLTDRAELVLVAPATANTIAHMALGLAPNALATLLLAVDCPVLICPAMNPRMWKHPAVQANLATLKARGVWIMEPATGSMACGHTGPGRLPEPAAIMRAAESLLQHGELGSDA